MFVDIIELLVLLIPYFLPLVIIIYSLYKIITPFHTVQHDISPICYRNKKRDFSNIAIKMRKMGTKIPPPFPTGWYGIMESDELRAGEITQVDCLGENFAVFRTMDGKPHVTDAYCPHLGASFANGGLVREECIECPFHGWRFNAETGKCSSIPNVETVPKGLNIGVRPTVEMCGTIYFWHDKESRSPDWNIPIIKEIENEGWIYYGTNEYHVATHVQDLSENASDMAHFVPVHTPNLLAGKVLPFSSFWNIFGIHDWSTEWEVSDKPSIANFCFIQNLKFFGKYSLFTLHVTGEQVGPGLAILRLKCKLFKLIIIMQTTPIEPLLQRLVHRIYAPWYLKPMGSIFKAFETVMLGRDINVWNNKSYINNPPLVKPDKYIKAHKKWFSQFYTPNSIPFKQALLGPKKDLIDW